jgi:hypothetical protein
MPKQNKNSYKIDADYTEDVVGFALESFLTLLSFPRHRFTIEPFSRAKERWLGADARLHSDIRGFRPFYMQFKRPAAYPDYSAAGIIKDRKALGLPASPQALYFALREKRDGQSDFQHNVLLRLRQRLRNKGLGDAAYVCPLFLDRSAYRFHLHWAGLWRWPRFWRFDPWDLEDVLLTNGGSPIRFDRVPVLAEHITIPPHDRVASARHRYSFTDTGTDLCFHSPQLVPDGATSLGKFLSTISTGFLDGGEKVRAETANEDLRSLIEASGELDQLDELTEVPKIAPDDPIGNWLAWGDHLRFKYDIDQYALVSWRE